MFLLVLVVFVCSRDWIWCGGGGGVCLLVELEGFWFNVVVKYLFVIFWCGDWFNLVLGDEVCLGGFGVIGVFDGGSDLVWGGCSGVWLFKVLDGLLFDVVNICLLFCISVLFKDEVFLGFVSFGVFWIVCEGSKFIILLFLIFLLVGFLRYWYNLELFLKRLIFESLVELWIVL